MIDKKLFFTAIVLLIISFVVYFFVFHNGLSDDHEKWASFGSYIGGIGSIIVSISLFYYTYTVDKNRNRIERNNQILRLIEIVSESLILMNKWKKLSVDLSYTTEFENGDEKHSRMIEEKELLENQIWKNYKSTQILTDIVYGKEIPNVDNLQQTENNFIKVKGIIKTGQ